MSENEDEPGEPGPAPQPAVPGESGPEPDVAVPGESGPEPDLAVPGESGPEPGAVAPMGLDPEAAISRHRGVGHTPDVERPEPGPDPEVEPDPLVSSEPEAGPDSEVSPDPKVSQGPDASPGVEVSPGTDVSLDPETAIASAHERRGPPRLPPPVIDTRKYQFAIGGIGVAIILALSIYLFLHGHSGTPGIAPGQRLPRFVAPLATSNLDGVPSNAHPVCNPARPSPRGLNVCDRGPLVLELFATGESTCVRQVNSLQTLSERYRYRHIQFAAVAINATRATTDALVRRHHWTIPVAYDLTGTIGQVYGVEVCPMVEVARAGGIVQQRLIGGYWVSAAHLAQAVSRLAPAA